MAKQWVATCKDCGKEFQYSDYSYTRDEERGFSRPERCPECRILRRREIDASGAGYFQIRITGEEPLQPGILGDVYHGERPHTIEDKPSKVDKFKFGIKEDDIKKVYHAFDEEGFRIAIIEGPTGSGKSTLLPFRLLEAPPGVRTPDIFTRDGQIIVTQPRILPTSGISEFISESLLGSSVGPGVDIGYKFSSGNQTDRRNRLVFVTDGTLVNWIKNDQLTNVSVIMIDEAHERSKNIDLILMLLRNKLSRYPNLKLIIASATINPKDFIKYYGGEEKVKPLNFEGIQFDVEEIWPTRQLLDYDDLLKRPSKQIDEIISDVITKKTLEVVKLVNASGYEYKGDILLFLHSEKSVNLAVSKIKQFLSGGADSKIEIFPLYRNLSQSDQNRVLEKKAKIITNKVVRHWSLLKPATNNVAIGVLLDEKSVLQTVESFEEAVKDNPKFEDIIIKSIAEQEDFTELAQIEGQPRSTIFTTYKLFPEVKKRFPSAKVIEDWRIIIATNVAETSLTVDGTVHVIDSGLIKQNVFDPKSRTQRLISKTHSQAGCKQRKGRAGRIREGFAHYIYTKEQFESFEQYTPPEVERSSLEDLVLQVKAAGVGDFKDFQWFNPTDEMLQEINSAEEALKTRGAIDSDGDITESGLDMLAMPIDPILANLLMKADQLCCALEAATILSFLSLNASVLNGLFIWNRNWDSTTRWEVKHRQNALFNNCIDDFELILRTLSAWESVSENINQRSSWARQMYVNHDFIKNQLLPARTEILETLSAGMRGNDLRPVNLNLLDRLRFAAMLAVKDQISVKEEDFVSWDSCCWNEPPEKFVYLRKTPFKYTNSNKRSYQVSLIGSLKKEWLSENFSDLHFTEYIPTLNNLSPRDPNGNIVESNSTFWPLAALYPPDSSFQGRTAPDKDKILISGSIVPAPKIEEVAGWGKGLELETEYQIEEETGNDAGIDETKDLMSKVDGHFIDENFDTFTPPSTDSTVSIYFSNFPASVKYINISSDEGWNFKPIELKDEKLAQFMLPPGEYHLHFNPIFTEKQKLDYQANLFLWIEERIDYLVFMGRWRGKYPCGNFVTKDIEPRKKGGRPYLRIVTLGWGKEPIDIKIDKEIKVKGNYYLFNKNQTISLDVLRKEPSEEENLLLGSFKTQLQDGKEYTLLIHHQMNHPPKPDFELLEGNISNIEKSREKINVPVKHIIDQSFLESVVDDTIQNYIITQSQPANKVIEVFLTPKIEEDSFQKFIDHWKIGDHIAVKPLVVDLYPNGNENALIVNEPKSGLNIAVRAQDLFFESYQSHNSICEFLKFEELNLEVEWIDQYKKRVGVTRLNDLSEKIRNLGNKKGTLTLYSEILKIEKWGHPTGLILNLNFGDGFFMPGMVWDIGLQRSTTKPMDDFVVGEKIKIKANFTGGKVKVGQLTHEQKEFIRTFLKGINIKSENHFEIVWINRPIAVDEYISLTQIDGNSNFQWMVRELFRRSNQPRVDYLDEEHINEVKANYKIDSIVQVTINQVRDKYVEVEADDGVFGRISVQEWSNKYNTTLTEETQEDEQLLAKIISMDEVGHITFSRKQASMEYYQVDGLYLGEITFISDDYLSLDLIQDLRNNQKVQSLSTRVFKNSAIHHFIQKEKSLTLQKVFKIGERRAIRIIKVEKNRSQLTGTICGAYHDEAFVPVRSARKIGLLLKENGKVIKEIQQSTWCNIQIQKQGDGSAYFLIESDIKENIDKCVQEIRVYIPELVLT